MSRYQGSIALHERARRVLPGGVSSNFRYHAMPVPLAIERGEGAYVFDADGNRYIDYILGNGPAILGHSPAAVLEAVRESLSKGQTFAAVHPGEVALAEYLTQILPCAEQLRFDVTGTQGDHIALRLARAKTGKTRIVKFEGQYHGWADDIMGSVAPALNQAGPREAPLAVPQSRGQSDLASELLVLPFNDAALLEAALGRHAEQVAAIILEPIACNAGVIEPEAGYLETLRSLCDRHGIVLIFDEVITGFRAALGGAQQRYGVTPDLAVFAKAAAGGFPLSIVVGKREIMQELTEGVVHGGTYNAVTCAIAACRATVESLAANDSAALTAMEAHGQTLMAGLQELGRAVGLPLHCQGIGTIFSTIFTETPPILDYRAYKESDEVLRLAFVEALQQRGIRTTPRGTWFLSTALSDADIEETLSAAKTALESVAQSHRRSGH